MHFFRASCKMLSSPVMNMSGGIAPLAAAPTTFTFRNHLKGLPLQQVAPAAEGAKEKKPKKGAGVALGKGCEVVWAALKIAISAPPSAVDG